MVCQVCGASVPEGSLFCESCGAPLASETGQTSLIFAQNPGVENPGAKEPEVDAPVTVSAPTPKKPKKKTGLIVAIILAILLTAALAVYFTVHFWEDANCTEAKHCKLCGLEEGEALGHAWEDATCNDPQFCKVCDEKGEPALGHSWLDATCEDAITCEHCGETQGEALGHVWSVATCTEAETCTVCKEENGKALGHDWEPATYDTPKTCNRCSLKEGKKKGYIGYVDGNWIDETFNRNYARVSVVRLDRYLENCFRFTVSLDIFLVDYGSPYGNWQIFVRGNDGRWVKIKDFKLESDSQQIEVELDNPVSFQDIVVICQVNGNWSFSYYYSIEDVQLRVD